MLPGDPTKAKVAAREPQGYVGELAESGGRRRRVRRGRDRARVVYSLGGAILAVSDSALNEPRVGFLSHPRTMCRVAAAVLSSSTAYRVFAFGSLGRRLPASLGCGLYRFSASDIVRPRPRCWFSAALRSRPASLLAGGGILLS